MKDASVSCLARDIAIDAILFKLEEVGVGNIIDIPQECEGTSCEVFECSACKNRRKVSLVEKELRLLMDRIRNE